MTSEGSFAAPDLPPVGEHATNTLDPSAGPTVFERMPHEGVAAGLVAADAATRLRALTAAVQPDAPIDSWARELVGCVDLSRGDALALQVAATAFCMLKSQPARDIALPCVVTLASIENAAPVRLATAHCFWLYKCIPTQAWPAVVQMVFCDDSNLRRVAFGAALPHAEAGAGDIAAAAAAVGATGWTPEGMDLLAASAGNSDQKKRQIESYVLRSLKDATSITVMVAGYAALARLIPKGAGVTALAQMANVAPKWSDATIALSALTQLGDLARPAIPALVNQLVATDDAEREEDLCRCLLTLQISEREVPIARVLQRLEAGPDKAVIGHSMLLGLHPKPFARAAPIVAARFSKSSEELKPLLSALYEMLTGKPLIAPVAVTTP